jgi:hypothetical protein
VRQSHFGVGGGIALIGETGKNRGRLCGQQLIAPEDVPNFVDFRRRSGDHQATLLV